MPQNNGAFNLGQIIGGGDPLVQEEGFAKGQLQRAQSEHLSAQTNEALENAKIKQLDAQQKRRQRIAGDGRAEALLTLGVVDSPEKAFALSNIIEAGDANYTQAISGRGDLQKQGFTATLGNPAAAIDDRLAASSALKGEIANPLQTVPGEYMDVRAQEGGVNVSPNTASQITDRAYRAAHPELFRQTPKTPEEIYAEAKARKEGQGEGQRALDFPQARARFKTFNAKQDEISTRARDLAGNEDLWKSIGAAKTLAQIPGTEGATIRAKIKTLVAKLAVQAVAEARELSKTGGAYGNTNAREWEDIGQSLAAINENMAPSAAREELIGLADRVELAKQRSAEAFYETYPEGRPGGNKPPAAGGPPSPSAEASIVKWGRDANGNPVRVQ